MELIFATNNNHKLEEIKHLTRNIIDIKGLSEVGIVEDIPETHDSLVENAIEKAKYIYDKFGMNCFADDTGLEIDALGGKPGVFSARYAGQHCSSEDNMNKVLRELQGISDRKARFKTVIALIRNGNVKTFEGQIIGEIINKKTGNEGFGYDPIFIPNDYSQTFAEMDLNLKNKISHRARALEKFIQYLNTNK